MELSEATALLQHPATEILPAGTWADLGCGSGLFTFALAGLLPAGSILHAIDREPVRLSSHPVPPHITIIPQQADFIRDNIAVSPLGGIMMANSLHYVADKPALLRRLKAQLAPGAVFIIVEYDTAAANPWVPYPVGYNALLELFREQGFGNAVKLGTRVSIYRQVKMYAVLLAAGASI